MLIYLDLCCFNRPYDDQTQLVIRLQTEAKLYVQDAIVRGDVSLAWSAIMDLENEANPDIERKNAIGRWKSLSVIDVDPRQEIEDVAQELVSQGLKPMDALHVASAIFAGATWLLTTDKAVRNKMNEDPRLRVVDPVEFIQFLQENTNED